MMHMSFFDNGTAKRVHIRWVLSGAAMGAFHLHRGGPFENTANPLVVMDATPTSGETVYTFEDPNDAQVGSCNHLFTCSRF
jgi:hypothetical protein